MRISVAMRAVAAEIRIAPATPGSAYHYDVGASGPGRRLQRGRRREARRPRPRSSAAQLVADVGQALRRGPLERSLRMRRAQAEGEIDPVGRGDAVAEREVRLVREREPDAAGDRRRLERDVLAAPPAEARTRADPVTRRRRTRRSRRRSCARAGAPRRAAPGAATARAGPASPRPACTAVEVARLTSSPMRSMCSNGPCGKPSARIAPSISSIVAAPSSSMPQRLERERAVDAVDDEARRVRAADRRLAPALDERLGARRPCSRRCRGPTTTSTSGITGRRVEEVEADDPRPPRRVGGDRGDRQRARVGREDRARRGRARRASRTPRA